jgi:hypothetical protein
VGGGFALLEFLSVGGKVEPERDLVHAGGIGVLREGGDRHPVDGEHRDDHERREARVGGTPSVTIPAPGRGGTPAGV